MYLFGVLNKVPENYNVLQSVLTFLPEHYISIS
jgi:hypothetical protein